MKKIMLIAAAALMLFSFSAAAQDLNDFMNTFETFAEDAAPSIPMLADIGLRWSDSYIGGFPHFGVGVSAGFVVVPVDDIETLYNQLGITDIPQEIIDLGGLPIMADAVEARIGGFILPFDIGIKAGYIPDAAKEAMTDGAAVDYKMFGLNFRYRMVKEGFLMPEVSVGAGYTRLDGMVSTSVGTTEYITDPDTGSPLDKIRVDAPDVMFGWRSNVFDANIQVSKNILFILRPYAGLGVSYGLSEAGGGYSADIYTVEADNTTAGSDTLEDWKTKYPGYFEDLSSTGMTTYSEANGFAFRAYAGTSVELLFAKLDLSATLNPVSQAIGAQLNLRAQF